MFLRYSFLRHPARRRRRAVLDTAEQRRGAAARERDRDVGLARVVPEVLPQALERGRGRDSAPRRL